MAYTPPRTSEFRHIVSIERPSEVRDDLGGFVTAWVPVYGPVRACIMAERGGEEIRALRTTGITRYDVVLRIPSVEVSVGDRMIDETGAAYDIKWSGDLEGRGRQVNILAERGGLNG
ncbi:head-tail adaptor protein [Novosphingobium sp. TCA1]|uniref:head-tail adaptor protein n=1 Tax=Novosphingobium sp. TCA1 TaxID=2682474 RepID=UPI00130B5871|nr:head-tail adaptor protein [Novosphingobium sp. TCA1]GFE77510.1 hypothetical protein NTCA1_51590 [Novosphingobium sp. TCA1]